MEHKAGKKRPAGYREKDPWQTAGSYNEKNKARNGRSRGAQAGAQPGNRRSESGRHHEEKTGERPVVQAQNRRSQPRPAEEMAEAWDESKHPRQRAAQRPRPKKRRKKSSGVRRYFLLVALFVCLFLCAGAGVLAARGFFSKSKPADKTPAETQTPETGPQTTEPAADSEPEKQERLNVVLFGVDRDGYRTDVMVVVNYDPNTGNMNLLSVPRDTKVTMTDEIQKSLNDRNRGYPSGGVCKLNEVSAYAGSGYRYQFTVLQLEELLGISIDHYIKIDLDGFVAMVDAIGGVDINVPVDMDYDDPFQDLHIHLKAGQQHLDGAHAEQLVRFREGYAQKDLARIQTQQLFLKEVLKKMSSTETILNNLPSLVYTAFKYVETDMTVGDALEYIQLMKGLDMGKVTMESVPGEGGSYFTADKAALAEQVQRLFFDEPEPEPAPETNGEDGSTATGDSLSSKSYRIEVSNGSQTDGLAGQKKTMLERDGYYVAGTSTYYGEKTEGTRIFVRRDGLGADLLEYFPGATIETAPGELSQGTDIKIVLGTGEK